MCTTLPETLITVMGIEKVVADAPRPRGLPAAPAAIVDGRADEPLHVALDRRARGRRAASVPPGPARQRPHETRSPTTVGRAGAALHPLLGLPQRLPGLRADGRPRLRLRLPGPDRRDPDAAAPSGSARAGSLPYASSLCGACADVCPVRIDIPRVLVHLRGARGRAAQAERGADVDAGARPDVREPRAASSACSGSRGAVAALPGLAPAAGAAARVGARARAAGRARRDAFATGGGGARRMSEAREHDPGAHPGRSLAGSSGAEVVAAPRQLPPQPRPRPSTRSSRASRSASPTTTSTVRRSTPATLAADARGGLRARHDVHRLARPARPPGRVAAARSVELVRRRRPLERRPRRAGRRAHRLPARDRRDRHDRPRLRAGAGTPRAHARPGPAPLRRRRRRRSSAPCRRRSSCIAVERPVTFVSGPSATSDIELQPGSRRPRPAPARRVPRRSWRPPQR